jgi:hypothetical protein
MILIGSGFVLCGLALALGSGQATHAQGADQPTAEYVASECANCHREISIATESRHALALQDVSSEKQTIKADFKAGEKERTVTIPGENAPRPFTADDVTYMIGSGRYVERYLYRISRTRYAVFPADWNVEKKAWQHYVRGRKWPDDAA